MNSLGKKEAIPALVKYINQYKELEFEYTRIPSWRFIKQWKNIKARENLTRVFKMKTRKWDM